MFSQIAGNVRYGFAGRFWLIIIISVFMSPRLYIGLSLCAPHRAIKCNLHLTTTHTFYQSVAPTCRRTFYTARNDTWSLLNNLPSLTVIRLTNDMANPLPLQHSYLRGYVSHLIPSKDFLNSNMIVSIALRHAKHSSLYGTLSDF